MTTKLPHRPGSAERRSPMAAQQAGQLVLGGNT